MTNAAFERKFQQFVAICTEDYLVRYTNKGLYKRALKDIDKGLNVQYAWGAASVSCELSDGTICELEAGLEQVKCSCPADNLCKHILIAILFYAQYAAPGELAGQAGNAAGGEAPQQNVSEVEYNESNASAAGGELTSSAEEHTIAPKPTLAQAAAVVAPNRFEWLLDTDLVPMLGAFQASIIEEAMFRLRYPEDIEVIEDSLLTVRLIGQGAEVSFVADKGPDKALCKIKQRAGELIKLEALLRYRASKGLEDTELLGSKAYEVRFSMETVRECRELLTTLMRTGLARLPQSYSAELETLAVAAHSGNLPEVERSLRGIQGELELFFKRHVRFSMHELVDRVTRLYLALDLLERQTLPVWQQAQLAGAFRTKYFTVPRLQLYGLGAEPWETRSGYRGITYYMYSVDDKEIYTYSDVRAVYYDNNEFSFSQHYADFTPWLANLTMKQFAESQMEFHSIKVNSERRLSSGEGAKLTVMPRSGIEELELGAYSHTIASIREHPSDKPTLFAEPRERLIFIRLAKVTNTVFDKDSQSLLFTVEDEAGERLELALPYQADWASAIKRLEAGYGTAALERFWVFARIANGLVEPISFLNHNRVLSLKLDV
jgi:hypothetical protein